MLFSAENPKLISPMGRPATPDEVAYACLYLASDEASYCTGSVLTVDGGSTARA
jgi:NAD(P)-dependent dehydrogenase (short-subunit alcohol dehydrogenase family)